ncbi:MAG TPA: hypothetical protein VN131_00790 [Mobilitalea sp.]|nr:hypothetical protein [Mobilitalea sp.]
MKKSEIFLLTMCSFLLGLVIGFFTAPVKQGINIGNDSGNTVNNYDKEKAEKKPCENMEN